MDERALGFLKKLLDSPGPSGFEAAPARLWREEAKGFAAVTTDIAGNSVATLNPKGSPKIMLAGHLDEIGLMAVHIDDEGYIHFAVIGGWVTQRRVRRRGILQSQSGAPPRLTLHT